MGRFLDEPQKTYKGKFLDEEPVKTVVPDSIEKIPAYGGSEGMRRLAIGGGMGFGTTPGSEDVLPMAGQTLGGRYGLTAAGGAAMGELARQGVRSIRGDTSGIKKPRSLGLGPIGLPEAVPSVGREAAVTGTIEGLTRGAGRVLEKPTKALANRMMNSVIKPGLKSLKRNPNLGIDALEAGITGTRKQMLDKSQGLIDSGENALEGVLKSKAGFVDGTSVASELDSLKRPFANVGDDASIKAIEEVQKNLASKGKMTLEEANQLKRDLYSVIKENSYGKAIGEVSTKQSAMKRAARGLKTGIENVAPEVSPINKKIGLGVEVGKGLENEIARGGQRVLIPKLAGMGAGGLVMAGNVPSALGVLAGDQAINFLRSPWMMTGAAKNLTRIRSLARPIASFASEGARRIAG